MTVSFGLGQSGSDEVIDLGDSNDEEEEKEEVPKPATKKMNRAAVLR
jgi:hypothetical protein